jgi:hypothetical protein
MTMIMTESKTLEMSTLSPVGSPEHLHKNVSNIIDSPLEERFGSVPETKTETCVQAEELGMSAFSRRTIREVSYNKTKLCTNKGG